MSAREFIERVEALAGAATEGPWEAHANLGRVPNLVDIRREDPISFAVLHDDRRPHNMRADAAFIAASRTVVPQLTAALRAVLDLHSPGGGRVPICTLCLVEDEGVHEMYPCATVRAITDALGGEQA